MRENTPKVPDSEVEVSDAKEMLITRGPFNSF